MYSATYIIEQGITLSEVDYVDSNHIFVVFRIPHSEEKPLQIGTTISIIPHPYIIFYCW